MIRLTSIAALLLATCITSHAQWTQSAGPEGASILTIAASGGNVLAASRDNGLYRLDGDRWIALPRLPVIQLSASGGIFFARTQDGLLRSSDVGSSWSPTGLSSAIVATTSDPTLVYAVAGDSIYRSTDGGLSFSLVTIQNVFINTIAAHGTDVVIGSGVTLGYFRSTDGGLTWSPIGDDLPAGSVPNAMTADGATFHVSISGRGVYRSTDAGASWTPVNDGLPVNTDNVTAPATLAGIDGRIWGVGADGIFRNDGKTWTIVNAPASAMAGGNGRIYLGSGLGVQRSTDDGASWHSYNAGIRAQTVRAIGSIGSVVLADGFSGIHRTTDKGASWEVTDARATAEFATLRDVILARTFNDGILRSTDQGATWSTANDGFNEDFHDANALASSLSTAFVGFFGVFGFHGVSHWESGGVHRSTDGGMSWQVVNSGLPSDGFAPVPVWTLAVRNRLVIASTIAGMYRSTDNGSTWRSAAAGLPRDSSDYFGHLAFTDEAVYAGSLRRVYRSFDDGATWSNITEGLPQGITIAKMIELEGRIMVMIAPTPAEPERGRVFAFEGDRWKDVTATFPPETIVTTLLRADDRIYAGTQGRSVWSRGVLDVAAVDRPDAAATTGETGASPNPFARSTEIWFRLTRTGHTRVVVVNAAGRIVSTPFDGALEAGAHRIGISLDGEPPGAYFYRVIADGQMQFGGLMKLVP